MRRPSASWQRWPALLAAAAVVSSLWMGVAEAVSAGDFFVHSLPGAPDGPLLKMHAGHIEVTPEHNGNLFFWHFQNKHIANKQRTLIWLNGGPGCSSEDGALMEVGPYRLKDDHSLEYNEGSWNEFANVMFVDNPVGTGFSYVNTDSYVHELDEMADQFVIFLEKFFDIFPEYMHDDLYFAGESFAGQYIPYIAKHILDRNKKPTTQHPWALKGLLIGNGWIAPREQYEAYLDYAYENKLVEKGSVKSQKLEKQRSACRADLAAANGREPVDLTSCEEILQALLSETRTMSGNDKDCLNMYDVRLRDSYPSCGMNWPPDLPNLRSYLRRDDVIQALHVNPNKNTGWSECNGQVGSQFRPKESLPSITLLPDLLAEVPIALFSGADDLICNHLGTESMIGNMEWNGGKGFELSPGNWAPRREWTFEGKDAGFWQEARNLTYILYYESSHMVPFDHPRRTRDMLDRFMGVDISSIGGTPTDSRIDGERGPATTVGGASGNTTAGQMVEQGEVDAAKWAAYRRSGEIVLVIVAVAASAWGYYVWRERQKRSRAGYRGVASGPLGLLGMSSSSSSDVAVPLQGGSGRAGTGRNRNGSALENFRNKRASRDLEAGDFDEGELDDLHTSTPDARYSVGADSDDDDDDDNDSKASSSKAAAGKANGASNGTTESNGKGEEKSTDRVLNLDVSPTDLRYRILKNGQVVYVTILDPSILPGDDKRTHGPSVLAHLAKYKEWEEDSWTTLLIDKDENGIQCRMDAFSPHALQEQHTLGGAMFDVLDLIMKHEYKPRVWKVLFGGETLILKLARFPDEIPSLAKEVEAYRCLAGYSLAPKLVGYAFEGHPYRVVGILLEALEGRVPGIDDLARCEADLRALHSHLLHGDLNKHNMLIGTAGVRFLDFESSIVRGAQGWSDEAVAAESRGLAAMLRDTSGKGAPWE